jgi:hypothetical protein
MGVALSYFVENLLVHLPDFALAGGGYYLLRIGRRRFGVILLLLYIAALIGIAMSSEGIASYWPFIAAALGVIVAEVAVRFRV